MLFQKSLAIRHSTTPRVVMVDKNPTYPLVTEQLKEEKMMSENVKIRRIRYFNNIVEQDHRFIKKRIRSMLGFKPHKTATSILSSIEAMHMIRKGQLHQPVKSVQNEVKFIHKLFGGLL